MVVPVALMIVISMIVVGMVHVETDNDPVPITEGPEPYEDLALSFNFTWVNLTVPLNSRVTGWFRFELLQNGTRLGEFDDEGRPWGVPWKRQFDLGATFVVNVPDNETIHEFQVRAYYVRLFSVTQLDISDGRDTYTATIVYNLTARELVHPADGILDGSRDNGTDEPDAILAFTVETINFGYQRTYSWTFEGRRYSMSYHFDPAVYYNYQSRDHRVRSYHDFVTFATPDCETLKDFTHALFSPVSGQSLSDLQEAQYILNFVQALEYANDNVTTGMGEYPRFPVETLVDQVGDCEDTALLAASVAVIRGIGSVLVLLYEAFPGSGHAAPAFRVNATGSYYEFAGEKYFYGESTGNGWKIGEIPEFESTEAYVYKVT